MESISWPIILIGCLVAILPSAFSLLCRLAPQPRRVFDSEKSFVTIGSDGKTTTQVLSCWYDRWVAERRLDAESLSPDAIEPAEVHLSVVIPAYNEEKRIIPMLEEAVTYLDEHVGRSPSSRPGRGYEIIVIDDASSDSTVDVVLDFSRRKQLHDVLRVVSLAKNRGKGGAVTHGFRHVRGAYVLFADADGATRFSDVQKLLEGVDHVAKASGRGVAIGSRAHLVGSEAVVKRSALRNFLMRFFHRVLTILTPPATSRLRDTQCGFKLFTRAALPHIVPYMHAEGWIFDIEMLMLSESAPAAPIRAADGSVIGSSPGIKVAEVPVHWHEVGGSKLNVVQDSIKMAIGLVVLRASWMLGVYRRRLP
ncbi:hypothetical protein L249_4336 [Ophiocordyceps polyrhachis-furcata BCC 54312]|uniref:dolichyl-phosphate beta-glucosyltransferase n=1 Tax=Ophiocordyceps polyrhachis-furcata BCC 54312 TaxID=1330021 RepID=A0A367L7V6_9HYPO|nr:hypothetical protein L249_4336 [Ophiocordyceps polyrhachis-furcata BCC 54312]